MEGSKSVLDISSDEEPILEEKIIDYDDMINEWLVMPDEEEPDQDHVVVNELEHKSKSSAPTPSLKGMQDDNGDGDGDDDDCVILDGDPERDVTTSVVEEEPTTAASEDELLLVGEKGQVACRDFPHPRHLCAKFPFSSTPHEQHCEQCYCYVCDSLSPCRMWGNGLSTADHCHATAKSGMWKTLRKDFKLGKTTPIPGSTNYGTSFEAVNALHNHELPHDMPQFSPDSPLLNQSWNPMANLEPQNQASQPNIMYTSSSQNSRLLNQFSMPINIPFCSTTNPTLSHGANHARYPESALPSARRGYQSHSVPRQLLGVQNHTIQRARIHHSFSSSPQYLHSHMMSSGVNTLGSIPTVFYSPHDSFGLNNHVGSVQAQQYGRYHHATTGFSNSRTPYLQSDGVVPNALGYSQPISGSQHLSEHQIVNPNGIAQLGESQIECAGKEDFSSTSYLQSSRSINQVDGIKNLLFDEDENVPVVGAMPSAYGKFVI
ncbi:hypothetical protein PIB30_042350 [Stylosanthes scabra]|uniref:Uncharacterized protein n=1 Tax=Stylosanthes scabra TaxID=79078 RepID=A0ABU6TG63_9FABA|nr:hypothetical protein [Stylosanthes scabra]